MKFIQFILISVLITFSLVSCGGSSGSGNENMRALVQGDVSSEVLNSLISIEGMQTVTHTTESDLSGYDLLVLDGDVHDPETLATDLLLIDEALTSETPVLLVDAQDEHASQLAAHIGFAMNGSHAAYLIVSKYNSQGELEHTVNTFDHTPQIISPEIVEGSFEAGEEESHDESALLVDTVETPSSDITTKMHQSHASNIRSIIEHKDNPDFITRDGDTSRADHFSVGEPIEGVVGGKRQPGRAYTTTVIKTKDKSNPTISNDLTATLSAWAYYDPVEGVYKVFVNSDGRAYVGEPSVYQIVKNFIEFEYHLYQQALRVNLSCDVPGAFVIDSSPKNVNNETTYTDSVSTTIGGSISSDGISLSGERTVSHETTRTIKDWTIENSASRATESEWNFYQTSLSKKLVYSTLPALSRENLDFSNTTIFSIDPQSVGADRKVTFRFKTYRTFGTRDLKYGAGFMLKPIDSDTTEMTVVLPEIPQGS